MMDPSPSGPKSTTSSPKRTALSGWMANAAEAIFSVASLKSTMPVHPTHKAATPLQCGSISRSWSASIRAMSSI